jgi:hypothetical protein
MPKSKKSAKKSVKKSAAAPAGGLMAELAEAFSGTDSKLLNAAAANARELSSGGNRWEPDDGLYSFQFRAGESTARTIEKEGQDPYPAFFLALTVTGTDPDVEDADGKDFERPFFLIVNQDEDGEPVCYAASELKSLYKIVFEGEDYPVDGDGNVDLLAICQMLATQEATVECRVQTNAKGYKNYYWNGLLSEA